MNRHDSKMSARAYTSNSGALMHERALDFYRVALPCQDMIMIVLKHRDPLASALLGTNVREGLSNASLRTPGFEKHRPIPRRLYFIGSLIYNAVVAAAIGAASWAFLVLVLAPETR